MELNQAIADYRAKGCLLEWVDCLVRYKRHFLLIRTWHSRGWQLPHVCVSTTPPQEALQTVVTQLQDHYGVMAAPVDVVKVDASGLGKRSYCTPCLLLEASTQLVTLDNPMLSWMWYQPCAFPSDSDLLGYQLEVFFQRLRDWGIAS